MMRAGILIICIYWSEVGDGKIDSKKIKYISMLWTKGGEIARKKYLIIANANILYKITLNKEWSQLMSFFFHLTNTHQIEQVFSRHRVGAVAIMIRHILFLQNEETEN